MEEWLWLIIGALLAALAALLLKLCLLRKAGREIEEAFSERLAEDTNTLIDISGRDKQMRRLAAAINTSLRKLKGERRRFQQGDRELKEAITNISHDLRTPLTAICAYLDLLEGEEKSEAAERYVGIIKNRTELLGQLTEELFRYSVILAPKEDAVREPVELNRMLEESVAAFYTVLCERGITPQIQLPKEKVIRALDRFALSRVFSNLLHNAIKYSGGDLKIVLSETGAVTFSNAAPGLDKVAAGQLFDRFYTVEAARKSTGLGLAIAKGLVEQMGGSITADYENGCLSICVLFPKEVWR